MDGNSSSGGQNRTSQSHLDFISYWADQTVEQEIIRGHKLREIKPHTFHKSEYDVVNIDYIKPPPSTKSGSYRRKKSGPSCANCTYCKGKSSPPKSKSKSHKYRKQKKNPPYGLRIAELAVPTKRQCLDAWRRNYDILPAHMVERLRQYVLDQRPVVEIADALHCFKRKKAVKKEKSKRKKSSDKNIALARLKKPLKLRDAKTLCALFGHNIAKKLITPLKIELNSELQKIADVISLDIYDLMKKSKKVNMKTKKCKDMHIDVTKQVTMWVSDVLEESAYKILEDQCKDIEEEIGPALDLIDELIDNVVNIAEPEPEIIEIAMRDSEVLDSLEEVSTQSEKDQAVIDSDMTQETTEDHVQNEIIAMIDSIFKDIDIKSDDEMQDLDDIGQVDDTKSDHDIYMDVENDPDIEPSEFADAKDNFDNFQANDVNKVLEEVHENAPSEEIPEVDEDGTGKKVKFYEEGEETNVLTRDEPERTDKTPEKSSEAHIDFIIPNEDLLSDADESWPSDIQLPIVRPSESVSKSVTSLGNIMEDEEKVAQIEQDEDENEFQETASANDVDGKITDKIQEVPGKESVFSEEREIAPNEIEMTPEETTIIATEETEVTPVDTAMASEDASMANDRTLAPENAVVTTEDTVKVAKDTEVAFEDTEMGPDETAMAPEDSVAAAAEPVLAPEEPALAPDDSVVAPEYSAMALEESVMAPKDSVAALKEPASAPEEPVMSPEDYVVALEEPATAPDDSVVAAEDTIVTSDHTKVIADDTVVDVDDSVVVVETSVASEEIDMARKETNMPSEDMVVAAEDTTVFAPNNTAVTTEGKGMHPQKRDMAPEDASWNKNAVGSSKNKNRERIKRDARVKPTQMESSDKSKKDNKVGLPLERKKIKATSTERKSVIYEPMSGKEVKTPETAKFAENKINNLVNTKTNKTIVKKKSPRKEKIIIDSETAGTSQSVKDLSEHGRETAKDIQFASLRVKKNNYRVNVSTAPSWVTRAYGESTCVCIDMDPQPKIHKMYRKDNDIRRWVRDLEQGYENLKIWNEWIDTTSRTINVLQQEIGGLVLSEKCNKKPVDKLKELKTNIDKDAILWRKLRRCTQERFRNYRNYQSSKVRDCSRSLLH